MTIQGGGPIPTAMVTLARLGMKPGLIASVGDDIFGQFVIEELRKEGVEISFVITKKNPTALALGWVEKGSGRRTIVLNREITVQPRDLNLRLLPRVQAVHLDGRDLPACLKLARWAKRNGAIVVFDIGSMRNDVTAILPLVDHLVCAEDFALPYTGAKKVTEAISRLSKICPGAIVITSGIKGAIGKEIDSDFMRQRAFKVEAIDTTGAGDVYHGAYIYGLLKGWNLKKRMEFASAAAALKCRRPGGRLGIPTLKQVQTFLKRRNPTYA
jgi:sulfofructose kinase